MKIKKICEEEGAQRYGTCNECGKSSKEDDGMIRISFDQNSVCLCHKCFRRLENIIAWYSYFYA